MRTRPPGLALLALAAGLLVNKASHADPSAAFDKAKAVQVIAAVDLGSCKAKGGDGHVFITFDPKGKVSDVVVDKGDFGSAKVSKCIAGKFRKLNVPPFDGQPVRVSKSFHVESP